MFANNENENFLKLANEIIEEEERKNHHLLANELRQIISSGKQKKITGNVRHFNRYKANVLIPKDSEKGFPLLEIHEGYYNLDDVILEKKLKTKITRLLEEFNGRDLLSIYGLKPKQKLLFCGSPGTGKTLTAHVLSSVLGLPLIYVRFDSIVSSFLGETATNLRKIFDFIEGGEWVVLFDEFDIIGKKRDDPYEHGEIKRVVNNFMQMLDMHKGKSLIIAATNHQHLLDTAIWRRFDDILFFDVPDAIRREKIFKKYLSVVKKPSSLDLNYLSKITDDFSPADISQVCEEAIRKSILKGDKEINIDDLKFAIEEQKERKNIINII